MFQIIMATIKTLVFLTVVGFGMMDLVLTNPLDKEANTVLDPNHRKEDAQPIDKKIPYSSHEEEASSHQGERKDTIFHPSLNKATNKQQNQPGQVPHNADVPHETDTQKNSYLKQNHNSKDSKMKIAQKSNVKKDDTLYAFTASLSSNTDISQGSVIIFHDVTINEGEMYAGTDGLFNCPDDGIYMFIWSVRMQFESISRCLTSLVIGGEKVKYGPKTSYLSGYFSGGSQMVAVVQCSSAPVAVVSAIAPAPTYWGSSTFSGYRLASVESAVGFTAELSSDQDLFPGDKIVFDRVISNIGGQYDAERGIFECPDSGIYSFTVSAHFPEHENQWSVSKLVIDGETVLQGPITHWAIAGTDSGSSSVTAVVQCEQGKDVYVEAKEAYTFPYNVYGAGLTSFTGARLCSTDCDDYVAFSAVLTHNVTSIGPVVYDNVLINQGGAYNPSDGTFICPDDKLYVFTWSGTMTLGGSYIDLFFDDTLAKVNGMQYTDCGEDSCGTSGTSSQSTIIRCSTGSILYLRLTASIGTFLSDYSVFSGYRIPNQ